MVRRYKPETWGEWARRMWEDGPSGPLACFCALVMGWFLALAVSKYIDGY